MDTTKASVSDRENRVLMGLQALQRAVLVRREIGDGDESALLSTLPVKEAVEAVMIDATLFSNVDIESLNSDKEASEAVAAYEERFVTVTLPSGKQEIVALEVNVERCWVYLKSVLKNNREDWWRYEMLAGLGLGFIAYVMACCGKIFDPKPDEWREAMATLDREGFHNPARDMAQALGYKELELALLERHAGATHVGYGLTQAVRDIVAGSADELIRNLNLGDE